MLLMIPMTRFISKKLAAIQSQLMRVKDRRINTTSEALEGMKLIKLQSWEKAFLQRISGIRCEEIGILRKYPHTAASTVGTCSGRCCPPPCGTPRPTSCPSPPSPLTCSPDTISPRPSPSPPLLCFTIIVTSP